MTATLEAVRLPEAPFRIAATWITDVRTAADGTEQRASASALPRLAYGATITLSDAEVRTWRAGRVAAATDPYELVRGDDAQRATTAIGSGTTAITLADPTRCDWAAVDRRVVVVGPAGIGYRATISAWSSPTITLDDTPPSGFAVAAGLAHIYPIDAVLLEDAQAVTRYPVALSAWQVAGRASTARSLGGAGASVTTHDGIAVIPWRSLDSGGETYPGGVQWQDAGGAVVQTTTWARGRIRRAGLWLIRTAAQRQAWRALLALVRGRFRPLLLPTWRPDLRVHTQPAGSATTIRVYAEDYAIPGAPGATWFDSPAHKRIQLEFADGSVAYRTVTAVTSGLGYYALTIAALPSTIPGGSVAVVSFLELVRLDVDTVVIEYAGGWTGRVALPFVAVDG